ncbi:MAG: ferritin family protein [Chloroflexota bacterium]|nr:ferritin family protein [Chloroflexota bacterium]
MDIRKIYEYALQREHEGKRFFEDNADRMQHAAVESAFRRLALEEQRHIDFIERLLEGLAEGKTPQAADVQLEEEGFFSQRAVSEMLDQTVMESMVPDLSVLRMAYLIERDFVEFYQSAAEQAEGEARKALEMLANWERDHERFFKQLHDSAFEVYAEMPWGG